MLYAFLKKILFSRYHKHVRTTYVYGKSERLRNRVFWMWLCINGTHRRWRTVNGFQNFTKILRTCIRFHSVSWHQFPWPPPVVILTHFWLYAYESQQYPQSEKIPRWPWVHRPTSVRWDSASSRQYLDQEPCFRDQQFQWKEFQPCFRDVVPDIRLGEVAW